MRPEILVALQLLGLSAATPIRLNKREVPQEKSHLPFLTTVTQLLQLDNPDNITDAVFGLLGNAAGAAGQGSISDTDCLQQATADRAFTNAKKQNDIDGMTAALVYRALERNTGKVGQASVSCTAIKAVNPEIAAVQQHQDPASDGAAQINKDITIALAQQIDSIGGNPTMAIMAGTFKPGDVNDPTAKGNSCDDDDPKGCIFTQNLLNPDVTPEEITQAVGNGGGAKASQNAGAAVALNGAASAGSAASNSSAGNDAAASANGAGANANGAASSADNAASGANGAASAANGASGNVDLGSCSNAGIVFGPGFDGRKEDSFQPADMTDFTHGSALNIKVITDFICQQLGSKCKASQDTVDQCNTAAQAAQGQQGQAAADAFNGALGQSAGATASGGAASGGNDQAAQAAQGAAQDAAQGAAQGQANNGAGDNAAAASGVDAAQSAQGAAQNGNGANGAAAASGNLDFGKCTNPGIQFGEGFDGRKDPSFQPANKQEFTHDSALGIQVITGFITDRLKDQCQASQEAIDAATQAGQAVNGVKGQGAADMWNAALGVSGN